MLRLFLALASIFLAVSAAHSVVIICTGKHWILLACFAQHWQSVQAQMSAFSHVYRPGCD